MDMWRVLQGGHVEGLTGWTGAPVEDPPDLKNSMNKLIIILMYLDDEFIYSSLLLK